MGDLELPKDVVISGPWARLADICYHIILSVFISLGVRHSSIAKSVIVYLSACIMSNHWLRARVSSERQIKSRLHAISISPNPTFLENAFGG